MDWGFHTTAGLSEAWWGWCNCIFDVKHLVEILTSTKDTCKEDTLRKPRKKLIKLTKTKFALTCSFQKVIHMLVLGIALPLDRSWTHDFVHILIRMCSEFFLWQTEYSA